MSPAPQPPPGNPPSESTTGAAASPPPAALPAIPSPPVPLRQDPVRIAFIACASGIVASFFTPWFMYSSAFSGFDLYKTDWWLALVPPALALATLGVNADAAVRRRAGNLTAVLTWATILHFLFKSKPFDLLSLRWGASLTLLFGLGLFALSSKQRLTIPVDLVARKLNSRKAEVFSHWGTLTADLHFSTQDFYAKIEEAIRTKTWPGVRLLRVEYREAGLLSHSREYLRIIRGRQLFDVCAASFGKDYFFSVREAEIPAVVDFRAVAVLALTFLLVTGTLLHLLGLIFGFLALLVLAALLVWLLFNILKLGLTKVDAALVMLPVIGPVYEAWFRRDTYFQQDTRIFFLQCVAELVKRHVAEITSANGVKLLNGFEKKPILGGLYQPFVLPLTPAR